MLAAIILLPPLDIYQVKIPVPWGVMDPVRITQSIIWIFFVTSLCAWALLGRRLKSAGPALVIFAGFSILVVSRLPIRSSLFISVNFLLPFLGMYLLLQDDEVKRWLDDRLVPILLIPGSIAACVGIAMHFDPFLLDFIPYIPWRVGAGTAFGVVTRLGGLQIHPKLLGTFMLVFSLLSLGEFLSGKRKVYLVPLAVSWTALFLSYSRSALIIFVLFFAAAVLQLAKARRRSGMAMIAVAVAVAALLFVPLTHRMQDLLTSVSLSHRAQMYRWAVQNFDGAWGWLFGRNEDVVTWLLWHNPPPDGLKVIDNIYLTVALQYGICGLVLLLALLLPAVGRGPRHGAIRWALAAMILEGLTFDILLWQNATVLIAVFTAWLWQDRTVAIRGDLFSAARRSSWFSFRRNRIVCRRESAIRHYCLVGSSASM